MKTCVLLFTCLSSFLFFSCGGPSVSTPTGDAAAVTVTTSTDTVGTIISNPRISLFPEFKNAIVDVPVEEVPALIEVQLPHVTVPASALVGNGSSLEFIAAELQELSISEWRKYMILGAMTVFQKYRGELDFFGKVFLQAILEAGIQKVTDSPQTIIMNDVKLLGPAQDWQVEIFNSPENSAWQQVNFSDVDGFFRGRSLSQGPIGGFLYVGGATDNLRLAEWFYDVSNREQTKMVVVNERKERASGKLFLAVLLSQCNTLTKECMGWYGLINEEDPTHKMRAVLFSWDQEDLVVCDGATLCGDGRPFWAGQAPAAEDFPLGYAETTPFGGTAGEIVLDGVSQQGWDRLTPEMIEAVLSADFSVFR